MTWGKWYWPVWLLVTFLSFIVMEIFALVENHKNTLSDWVWQELHITAHTAFRNWTAVDLLVFCVYFVVFVFWLPWHFWFHRFT